MLRLAINKTTLETTISEYETLYNLLDRWQTEKQQAYEDMLGSNEGLCFLAFASSARKNLKKSQAFLEKIGVIKDTLHDTHDRTKALIARNEDFVNILKDGTALESYDNVQTEGDILYFDDEYCSQNVDFVGKISINTGDVLELGKKQEMHLSCIEEALASVETVTVDIADDATHIRDCIDKQNRTDTLYSSLHMYGVKVRDLNEYVNQVNAKNFDTGTLVIRKHVRSYNYNGVPSDKAEVIYHAALRDMGYTNEEIEYAKELMDCSTAHLGFIITNMDADSKEFTDHVLHGEIEKALEMDPEFVSDDALYFAFMYQSSLLGDEDGELNEDFEHTTYLILNADSDYRTRITEIAGERLDGSNNRAALSTYGLMNYATTTIDGCDSCSDVEAIWFSDVQQTNGVITGVFIVSQSNIHGVDNQGHLIPPMIGQEYYNDNLFVVTPDGNYSTPSEGLSNSGKAQWLYNTLMQYAPEKMTLGTYEQTYYLGLGVSATFATTLSAVGDGGNVTGEIDVSDLQNTSAAIVSHTSFENGQFSCSYVPGDGGSIEYTAGGATASVEVDAGSIMISGKYDIVQGDTTVTVGGATGVHDGYNCQVIFADTNDGQYELQSSIELDESIEPVSHLYSSVDAHEWQETVNFVNQCLPDAGEVWMHTFEMMPLLFGVPCPG